MHSARINQIRATADFSRIVSVSQDKTARVWRADDLQLLRTLHVPSEPGEEGALRAVALTPDGRHAIVGGWTGIAWRGQGQLYRFELATGRLTQTWRGLPSIIEALAVSPDGRHLAVGLGGTAGLRVLELASGREVAADTEYAERVSFVDYAPDGTLATTSADGCLRLYAPDGRIVFRAAWPPPPPAAPPAPGAAACPGGALGGVRFSPDGRRLAFGHQERAELVVMEVATRRIERVVKPDDPRQRSLCCPNWAAAGEALFMHGTYDHPAGGGPTPLYRLDLAGGGLARQEVGRQRFTNVLPLPGGDVLFSTTAPSLARLDAGGRVRAEALPPNGDFRFAWERFAVSADGQQLQLPMKADGSAVHRFDLAASPDQAFGALAASEATAAAANPPALAPPLRSKSGAAPLQAALDDLGYLQPVSLGPQPVRLKPFQSVRSWAHAPADDGTAVGTQWSVLELDGQGRVRWEHDLPAPAFQVTVTANGRWVVVAVGDGTVRWFDREGRERLGLFLHAEGREWVAWRHDGYYASSPGGDAFIGWLLNRGDAEAPDFFRAVQFERRLYRPDLVAGTLTEPARGSSSADDLVRTLQALAPPRVTIERLEPAPVPGQLSLRVAVQPRGRTVRELGVYVDGVPLLRSRERSVAGAGDGQAPWVREFTVPAADAALAVRVEAETDESIGSDETAPVRRPAPASRKPGRLWMVAVGVHRFDHLPDLTPLPFATNDARELAAALRAEQGRTFTEVRSVVITEAEARKPTRAAILAALGALQDVGPDDTTVVFLASHGTTDAAEYYFVTKDTTLADANRVIDAQAARTALAPGSVPSLITGSELTAALRRLPGRRIVILDTCESSAADGRANPHTLLKRSASAQLAVMSAATGSEFSYDSLEAPHGVFTFALLSVLRQAREPQTLRRLFDDAQPRVQAGLQRIRDAAPTDAERAKVRQTPMLNALPALERTVLVQRP